MHRFRQPRPAPAALRERRPWAFAALLAALLSAPGPAPARAQVRDPDVRWRTLRTEHFEVHYHEPLGLLARRLARTAERVRRQLRPVLGEPLSERTLLVLTDGTDFANGSAQVVPRAEVRLRAVAPEDLSFLEDHGDWLHLLLVHEQAHVLHLATVGGLPALLDALLGRLWTPNNAAPRWLVEGLATWQESERTGRGRLRSSLVRMVLRADALEGRQPSLALLSGEPDRWPRGHLAYLYGGRFVGFVAERCGPGFWRRYAELAGRQVVPYALNRYAKRLCGRSFVRLYEELLEALRREARATVAARRNAGLREGRRLTFHGEVARRPRFVAPDRLAYVVADERSDPAVRLLAWPSGRPLGDPVRAEGSAALAPIGRSGAWLLSRLEPTRDIYALHDLVRFEPRSGRTRRLTFGLRAREPDVGPDGATVVFVLESAGTRHLALARLPDVRGTMRLLLRSERFGQLYCPRLSPDGATVAFSWRRPGGARDVALLSVAGGPVRLLTDDPARDGCPAWSRDGRFLFFSSDRDGGVPDLYAWPVGSERLLRVTRVRTGAFHPEPSPDGRSVVYVGYTSRGFDLFAVPFEPGAAPREPLHPEARRSPSPPPPPTEPPPMPSRPYDPLRTLGPRYWWLQLDGRGALGLGPELAVLTDGGDVVGLHRYRAAVRVPLRWPPLEPSAELSWRWAGRPVPVSLFAWHRVAARGGLVVGGRRRRWLARSAGLELGTDYAFVGEGTFSHHRLHGAVRLERLWKAAPFGGRLDPNDPPPRLPWRGLGTRLRAGWSWSNARRRAWDVSTAEGTRLASSVSLTEPLLGGRVRTLALRWAVARFWRAPWHRLHVLALRYAGGLGLGWDGARAPRFALGGFGERPLLDVVLGAPPLGGVALRGHPPGSRVGSRFQLAQLEWRFPLLRPQVGWQTLPLYLRRLWGTLFADAGDARDQGWPDPLTLGYGLGAELHADLLLGYYLPLSVRVGVARGFGEGGEVQWYLHAGTPF